MFVQLTELFKHDPTPAVYFYGAPPARWHRVGIDVREAPYEVWQDKVRFLFIEKSEYMGVIPLTIRPGIMQTLLLQCQSTAPVSVIPLTKGGNYANS